SRCYRLAVLFFFSSRRRHTSSKRDWSSDVCSSDLAVVFLGHQVEVYLQPVGQLADGHGDAARAEVVAALYHARDIPVAEQALEQIGRASCREKGEVVGGGACIEWNKRKWGGSADTT